KSLAGAFLSSGYSVTAVDKNKSALEDLLEAENRNPHLKILEADLSQENEIRKIKSFTLDQLKRADCLVNNAAVLNHQKIEGASLAKWNETLAVNLTAPFLLSSVFASELKKNQGNIINIASTRAFMSEADTEAYSASKGGLISLTHALAVSLSPDVRVNSISPGWIHVSDEILSREDHNQHPAGRVGISEDISNLAVYLASDKSGFITGQNFTVDGGMTKKMIYL
ncbi:MAG: SDR family oxidoreductase, partial [Spirochaetia bacterium]|nr:SDR family oxidoreductase [Spirochaetia bacterium]